MLKQRVEELCADDTVTEAEANEIKRQAKAGRAAIYKELGIEADKGE